MLSTYFATLGELNHLAVLVAGLAAMALGVAWYSPALFGKQWMAYHGFKKKDMDGTNMAPYMIGGLMNQWITAYVLASFLALSATGAGDAAGIAFWLWLGFVGTTQFAGVLWEKKAPGLWVLDTSYRLASLVVMALIIGAWV